MSAWFSVKHGGHLRANRLFELIFLAPFIGLRVSSRQLVLQIEIINLDPSEPGLRRGGGSRVKGRDLARISCFPQK